VSSRQREADFRCFLGAVKSKRLPAPSCFAATTLVSKAAFRQPSVGLLNPLVCGLLAAALVLGHAEQQARAGGGPENVLLLVNQRSWASKTVANHYIKLRHIPVANVVFLDWADDVVKQVQVDTFRQQILGPALAMIRRRGLGDQIDYVIYSADFPYAVNLRSDVGPRKRPKQLTPIGSINGLTYLSSRVMKKDLAYLALDVNFYMRQAGSLPGSQTHGFRSWYGWGQNGQLLDAGGEHYMLSTMLAATTGRGNSVAEATESLRRSAAADGTHPAGTIYFASTKNPRSQARAPAFTAAIETLKSLGVRAEIVHGPAPRGKDDVAGMVTGDSVIPLAKFGSTILPGAICDNLTSYGGALADKTSQTPLTDFLRFGAAGASGSVVEPYLITQKFPFPFLQVHYARGCSLAESFYQSVHGPYQLLIVGDPLCRPWANLPRVAVRGIQDGQSYTGTISLTPSATWPGDTKTARFELFVDGQRRTACHPGKQLTLDTRSLVDGYHDLRVVATERGAIESQGHVVRSIHTDNFSRKIHFSASVQGRIRADQSLTLSAEAPGAQRIAFFHASRLLGIVQGDRGHLDLKASDLGEGPVLLRAIGLAHDDPRNVVVADPVRLTIDPAPPLGRLRTPLWKDLQPGIRVQNKSSHLQTIQDTSKGDWLETAGVGPNEPYRVTAYFFATKQETYQFQLRPAGRVLLAVDGKQIADVSNRKSWDMHYVSVTLQDGLHRFELHGQTGDRPRLDVRFGGPGARRLSGGNCRFRG